MANLHVASRIKFNGMRVLRLLLVFALMGFPFTSFSESVPNSKVVWGAFVDSYYAYDFENPPNHDRAFTTQPARSNEFNVNLAFVDVKLNDENVHGRFALQTGTSVQSNYASEPTMGVVSGPSLSRNIQEGFAGYRLAENLWVDGGIFLSHIGFESFVSRDNWNYTRSLVADYSPYYQSGVRLSYQASDRWSGQLLILNGWQNISENNDSKSLGTQIVYTANPNFSVTYNTLIGEEKEFRHFHDLILKYSYSDSLQFGLQADFGFQDQSSNNTVSTWYGTALFTRYALTKKLAFAGRIERYDDQRQVIVTTGTPNGFQIWDASVNADVQLDPRLTWRSELRAYSSKDSIFPSRHGTSTLDGVFVTSFGLSI